MECALYPAALERARHDQPLDLAGALPDAVDAQLAVEALGHVRAHVARPLANWTARSAQRQAASLTNSLAIEALACTTFGSAPASTSRATSRVSSRPAAASAAESASGNDTPW